MLDFYFLLPYYPFKDMSCFCKDNKRARLSTLKDKIRYRIKRSKEKVFLVKDFVDLSGRDQILRALRTLIEEKLIIRVGKGVYVKARQSIISDELVPSDNLRNVAISVMKKLKIEVRPTPAELAYNARQTTQVPNSFIIGVNKRVSRNIQFNNISIRYEQVK